MTRILAFLCQICPFCICARQWPGRRCTKALRKIERVCPAYNAYELFAKGRIPKCPLLADDKLMVRIIGRHVALLIDRQKEWEEYDQWIKDRFHGVRVL